MAVQQAFPSVPMCLREGVHVWEWPKNGWVSAQKLADDLLSIGAQGVIAQAGLSAPKWLAGRDAGSAKPRVEVLRDAGLQVIAGFGMDGHHVTSEMVAALVDGFNIADAVMGDWESPSLWENSAGRGYASSIVRGVLAALPNAFLRGVDSAWWKPNVHSGAPTVIFQELFRKRFVQAYEQGQAGASEWELVESRREYPLLGIPATDIWPSNQMYGHKTSEMGRLILEEQFVCAWDRQELDLPSRRAFVARKWLMNNGPSGAVSATVKSYLQLKPGLAGLEMFQKDAGLVVDHEIGPLTLKAMKITL